MIKKSPSKNFARYLKIRIPNFKFKNIPMNGFLVVALVISAFALGMLTNKVIYLEKSIKENSGNTNAVNAQAQGAQPEAPQQVVNVENGKLPLLGKDSAKVTIVEFSDFQCIFCKKYFDETARQIYDKYIATGKVKFAYRHYPIPSIHPNARIAAEASECANEQGKFWEYHDLLFQNQE